MHRPCIGAHGGVTHGSILFATLVQFVITRPPLLTFSAGTGLKPIALHIWCIWPVILSASCSSTSMISSSIPLSKSGSAHSLSSPDALRLRRWCTLSCTVWKTHGLCASSSPRQSPPTPFATVPMKSCTPRDWIILGLDGPLLEETQDCSKHFKVKRDERPLNEREWDASSAMRARRMICKIVNSCAAAFGPLNGCPCWSLCRGSGL